ncbi:MAG: polyhydroxyalkanoate depolymerase [Oscillospiraceae bacterium]|nr:polyhydroxyalkanoate depolymerase [Oscillospiraceae bacterium]
MKSTTYYVSSLNGNDQNDGMSEKTPFLSLEKINQTGICPGDKILLEKGSVFCGEYLHLKNCGDINGEVIEIASYGEGDRMPRIETKGTGVWYQDYGTVLDNACHLYKGDVSSAVLLYDCENITIRDIEITNQDDEKSPEEYSAPHKMNRTGVAVVAQNRGTLHNITVDNLFVHDVNGNVYNKHMNNGGIYMTCLKPEDESKTGVARYDGVTVKNCYVKRASRWGIAVGYTYRHKEFATKVLAEEPFRKYGNENIVICGNYVKMAGGDAITPMYALEPLVEHNISDSCAGEMNDRFYRYPEKRMGKVAAAIWPWKCKNALFRFNEAVDTKLNQDGMAYDADSGDGTVYERNYSRLNEGGCVMFCLQEAIHNTFTDNVSYDDLGGTISPVSNPDAYIANNRFFVRKGVPFKRKRMRNGKVTLKNNEIIIIDK